MIKEGRISLPTDDRKVDLWGSISDQLLHASEEDLEIANYRAEIVRRRFSGETPPGVPARTLLRWASRYRAAESGCGSGYVGLLRESGSAAIKRAGSQPNPYS